MLIVLAIENNSSKVQVQVWINEYECTQNKMLKFQLEPKPKQNYSQNCNYKIWLINVKPGAQLINKDK